MIRSILIIVFISVMNLNHSVRSNTSINTLKISYNQQEEICVDDSCIDEPIEINSIKVRATMYNPVVSQCDKDPLVTAGMYKINPKRASNHKWIAMSRNLLKRWGGQFDYGDKVKIVGAGHKDGVYTIVDTMHPRFKNAIDFLETSGTKVYLFKNVEIVSI